MVKEKALQRMKHVVNGDTTGISKEVGWEGGGGFKFYKLGEPFIVPHRHYSSIKIINPKYHNTGLIKIICNLEGFKFRKSDNIFHGVNKLGNKYAHITEQFVSQAYADLLKSKLADNEELIIYCFNYDEKVTLPLNILIRKLPGDLGKPYQLRLGI
jgi:adenine-specific DNA-methyltransferase